jgi:Zn ribbon nucleic-acid-binding protein
MKNETLNTEETANSDLGAVMRSCVHCGNKMDFEVWTELEYDDGSDEPTTGNHLINVEFVKCLKCGEVL